MGPASLPAPRSPWRFRRFGRSPYPGFAVGRVAAVMRCRTPRAHRTEGVLHRDARRIGPVQFRPIGEPIRPFPFVLSRTIRWLDESRLSSPQPLVPVPSDGGFDPGGAFAFRLAVPRLPLDLAVRAFVPLRRSAAFLPSFPGAPRRPPAARHSLHLRFARPIPGNLRGVFSDTAAGIAAVSRLCFPLLSSGYPRIVQFGLPFRQLKAAPRSESRKQKLTTLIHSSSHSPWTSHGSSC